MLNICLTYDYELFLGKNNDSSEAILFAPTRALADMMASKNVSGVFFADVCSVFAHEKYGLHEYCNNFKRQLQYLSENGHDVQLHIHTNWLKSVRVGDEIELTNEGYRIHDFSFDVLAENSVQKIVHNTKEYLERVCREVVPSYKCIAYRAGGFALQPESEILKCIRNEGIIIDSSVVPRLRNISGENYFDFSKVPNKLNWWMEPEKGITVSVPKSDYTIYELPVASLKPRLFECLFMDKDDLHLPFAKVKKGEYIKTQKASKIRGRISRTYHALFDYRYISLDTKNYKAVMKDLEYIYKKYKLHKNDATVALIAHPKLADDIRVNNIANLIDMVSRFPEKYRFTNCMDLYKYLQINEGVKK